MREEFTAQGVKLLRHIFLCEDSWKNVAFDCHIEFRKYSI